MLRLKGLMLGLLPLLALLFVPFAHADDDYDSHVRIVRLSYAEGQVQVAHRQGIGYENATMNIPIVEGDQIRTSDDGWAEIQIEDGSTIRVAPESQITFFALGRYSSGGTITEVDLDQGEAEFKVKAHDDSTFRVNVRQRVLLLKHSGRFRVTSTNSNPLELVVWKGEVGVINSDDNEEVSVKKNEDFVIDPNDFGRYDLEQTAQADELDHWASEREDYLSSYAVNTRTYSQSPYQYGVSDLNYYGAYYSIPGYGYCWRPYGVNLGWDPFANGYWTYSPGFGFVWVSAYPWGWMPYRYGQWVFVGGYGWVWQPGLWNRWASVPRFVNPPSGFRAPVPPANAVMKADGGPARITVDRQGRKVFSNEDEGRGRGNRNISNEHMPVRPVEPQHMPSPEAKREVPNPVQPPAPIVRSGPPAERLQDRVPERMHMPAPVEQRTVTNSGGPAQTHVNNPPAPVTRTVSPPPAPVHVSPPAQSVSRPSPPPPSPAPSASPRSFSPPPSSPVSHGGDGGGRVKQQR
ncbi:MAG TPA: DUF6600 domain-containing protein [Candidatus Angelobacter sp.]|nr:DUF6600 domain-containing protein [Candidatus Angelobacter sp.]